jgi:hypothetical protein
MGEENVTLTPEQKAEALMPGLSTDTFQIGDKTFQLRVLPIFYERQLLRLVGSELEGMKQDALLTEFLNSLLGKLPEIVAVICYSQGALGTVPEQSWNEEKYREIVHWVERNACTADLMSIVTAQVRKNRLSDLVEGFLARGNLMGGMLGRSPSTQP